MSEESHNKVDAESAEHEFNKFVEAMDLDVDIEHMDAQDLTEFEKTKRRILKAIQSGQITVNSDGELTMIPIRSDMSEPIHFYEPTGATFVEMDRKKDGQNVGKMHNVIASMTKKNPGYIAKLKGSDYKLCTAIAALFLD